jgi:uncharacterized membrane protein YsdA (DUF1294 family)
MIYDYYQLLNLQRTATDTEINKAYLQQTKFWRSRLQSKDRKLRQEAERMLQELDVAKKVLLNTKKYYSDRDTAKSQRFSVKQLFWKMKKRQWCDRRYSKRRQFSWLRYLTKPFILITKGLSLAIQHVIALTIKIIVKIFKLICQLLLFLLIGWLAFVGFVGVILFVTGIYAKTIDPAFTDVLGNYVATGMNSAVTDVLGNYVTTGMNSAVTGISINYISMSIVAFMIYYFDKQKAKRGEWRIKESTLHSLELGGGWIGAFLGQICWHHKISKESFQRVYWLIVLFHLSLLVHLIPTSFPYPISPKILLIINGVLLAICLNAIKRKGNF